MRSCSHEDLEALVDEYYEASGGDPRRIRLLSKQILELVADIGLDRDADPSFSEALAVRRDREDRFTKYLADLQQSDLGQSVEVLENGTAPVQGCLGSTPP